ncbi:MAG: biotin/lipoyl-binding protein, partial [Spirochaetales bacterium]|nr:biotin/lipoyl-binding protein [Candidatus Physcosoma equi]
MAEKKEDYELTESERQEKKLRAANAARKRRRRIKSFIGWMVVILIVSLVLLWFLKMKKDSEATIAQLQERNRKIEYMVNKSTFDQEIDVSGSVVPYDTLKARFRSTGAVTGVYVKEGEKVVKGQLLATIDDTNQRMPLRNIENQIAE